jgi:hypothetical protein
VKLSSLEIGPIAVTFPQLLTVMFMIAAAMPAFSEASVAQDFDNSATIVIEPLWNNGYMGLGGGLQKAIVKPRYLASEASVRRPRRAVAARPALARHTAKLPARLISETLDPTGLNLVSVSTQ